jgi:hypothetical protein
LLFAGCLSASGAAQLDSGGMTFAVSRSFVAGEATLPAGSYKIVQDPDDSGVLQITNMAGSHSVMAMAELVETDAPRKKTEVIFSKYGNTVVLKQPIQRCNPDKMQLRRRSLRLPTKSDSETLD